MRLNQRQERLPPLQAPIPTKMVVSASVASVRGPWYAPFGRGSEGLLYLPCGAIAADLEQMAQPETLQRL